MDTNNFIVVARTAGEAARRRRARMAEFRAICSAGTMVFSGLLLAVLYCLLAHHIPA
jgi:hypothetical protein